MAATTKQATRIVVGSTCGRGPCGCCGLVAELHEAEERPAQAPEFVLRVVDACLPCSLNRGEVAPLRKAA